MLDPEFEEVVFDVPVVAKPDLKPLSTIGNAIETATKQVIVSTFYPPKTSVLS